MPAREVLQVVDGVGSATVLLDLNSAVRGEWYLRPPGPDFSPPPLRRAVAQTLLADGALVSAAAYDNRTIIVPLRLDVAAGSTLEQVKAQRLAQLAQYFDRPLSVLCWQARSASAPTFYRVLRSPSFDVVRWDPNDGAVDADLELLAEPFGLGSPVVLGQTAAAENANPYFEAGVAGWTGTFGTPTSSSAQAHEGTKSMLITPSGGGNTHIDDADKIGDGTSIAGRGFQATAWRYSTGGYASGVGPRINFYDAAQSYISTLGTPAALGAAAWALGDTGVVYAPAGAVYRQLIVSYTGTPTAGQTVHIDEAMMWATGDFQVANDPAAAVNGAYFDVDGVAGDVEVPAKFELSAAGGGGGMAPVLAVRRHGTPGNVTPYVQCETMTQGTDTTAGSDSVMSNGQRSRCTFATVASMATRLTGTFPSTGGAATTDRRGLYRMFLMVASSASSTTYAVRMRVDSQFGGGVLLTGDTVTYTATDTSRRLLDLGLLQVPLGRDPVSDGYGPPRATSSVAVQFQAQRVSGSGSLDMDFAAALFADTEQYQLGSVPSTGGSYDLVLDGVNGQLWVPWVSAVGEVHAYGAPAVPVAGSIPRLSPGQTNRILLLRPDAVGTGYIRGPDIKSRTTSVRVTYWPRFLAWAP